MTADAGLEAARDGRPSLDEGQAHYFERPHETLDALRSREPVHVDRERDRVVLTRARDVERALADRTLSSDPHKARPAAAAARGIRPGSSSHKTLVHLDDPDHARLRGLVSKAFTARAVEAMRPRLAEIASGLLDAVEPGRPFDLVRTVAEPLPVLAIAGMLGIADDQIDGFRAHLREIARLLGPARDDDELERFNRASRGIDECFARMIVERRSSPKGDLVGALVAAEHDGQKLGDGDILHTCRLLLVAGNITTTDLIGNGAVALLRHPAQLDRLRDEPSLWPAAVEEVLRFDAPVTRQHRQALDDREIDGVRVEAGQTVTAVLAAANRDPALHADPHGFDISRAGQRHFSFGGGPHFCLGASLARLETTIALEALFTRFPGLRLEPGREPRRKRQAGFNGWEELWMRPG